ncbi:hypothetical protein [Thalassotalea piscium]|uniref:Uncharacterized protein n=1 Tax=Thalassotalea piscium TaxID=1230533 RepID=A0A7X0NKI2_9GAMM|nr:hypothetical protein [Thalassotalea piscium]MBB6545118.1 hypothetical protein [Thalassotalea piscium]
MQLKYYGTVFFLLFAASGCSIKNYDFSREKVRLQNLPVEMTLSEALIENEKLNLQAPDYWYLKKDMYEVVPELEEHNDRLLNKGERFNYAGRSTFFGQFIKNIEYWLIRETKRRVEKSYIKSPTNPTPKSHTFKPHLYGGQEGWAQIFPLVERDHESYTSFSMFLDKKTTLTRKEKDRALRVCFSQLSYYDYGITTFRGVKYTHDDCADYLRDKKVPFYGFRIKDFEETKIVETFVDENPSFDTGFYHHFFNAPEIENKYTQSLSDFFKTLQVPNNNHYLINIPLDNSYILDEEIAFKESNLLRSIREDNFTATIASAFVRDNGVRMLYNSFDLRHAQYMGYVLSRTPYKNTIFTDCGRTPKRVSVAFESFTHIEYNCQDGGIGPRRTNYIPPLTEKAKVSVMGFFDKEYLLSSYTPIRPHYNAYVKVEHSKTQGDKTTQKMISKLPHHALMSWVSLEDKKIYGNVVYYGMLFKYNLTEFVRYRMKDNLQKIKNAKLRYFSYEGARGWAETLKLFPEFHDQLNDYWDKDTVLN